MDVLVPKACFKSVAIYWGVVWNFACLAKLSSLDPQCFSEYSRYGFHVLQSAL